VLPKVQLFGEPKAIVDNKEHRFQPSRRYQCLAYLAYIGSRVSREKLADVFWSHTDSQAARRNLRKVLFEAKNLEWAKGFDHDEQGASWQVETDVAAFEEAVKQKQWSEAVRLYIGSFLDGLQSNDGAEFDAWLEQERLRLEDLYQEAAEQYAEILERQGKLNEAIVFLKQLLARDALNETLHRQIMRLEFKQGNSEAALEQFERCREVLQKELGVEPLPETLELLKTIEQGGGTQAKRALLLKSPPAVPNLPVNLVGREKLLQETRELLRKGERVLLHGFGGMGKTALAATVTKHFITDKQTALWLQVGSDNPDVIFDALAQPFEAGQDIAQAEDKTKTLHDILLQHNLVQDKSVQDKLVQAKPEATSLGLLVLDDVWNAYTLSKVMEALPKGLPLLVTSRQRYPKLTKVYVDRLERKASLELLAHYAQPLPLPPQEPLAGGSVSLSSDLGSDDGMIRPAHGFSGKVSESRSGQANLQDRVLEVDSRLSDGGVLRSQEGHSAEENPPVLDLRGTKNASSVDVPSPPVRGDESEESANRLCELLGDHAFALRLAGLALREGGVTPEQLFELREVGRESVASLLSVSLETLEDRAYETFLCYGLLEAPVASAGFLASCLDRDVNLIEDALFSLVQRGLAERISKPGSDLVSYRIHDLAHSYAKVNRFQRSKTLVASALNYLRVHKDEVELLELDISNILAAAERAKEQKREDELINFMYLLTTEGKYFVTRGLSRNAVKLIEFAAEMAEARGKLKEALALLGDLGDYYQIFLGNYDRSITYYQRILNIHHETNNKEDEAMLLATLSQVKAVQKKTEESQEYSKHAYCLAKELNDLYLSNVLEKIGHAAGILGNMEKANQFLRESLDLIMRLEQQGIYEKGEITKRHFFTLLNFGETEYQLGNFDTGLALRGDALKIAEGQGNRIWAAMAHNEIGQMYHSVNQRALAREHLNQALQLFEQNNAVSYIEAVTAFLKQGGYDADEVTVG
jgi:DNA-binding SARP family transcriptional activator